MLRQAFAAAAFVAVAAAASAQGVSVTAGPNGVSGTTTLDGVPARAEPGNRISCRNGHTITVRSANGNAVSSASTWSSSDNGVSATSASGSPGSVITTGAPCRSHHRGKK